VYYYTSRTLNALHGTIGTVNGTLNGLHGTVLWCSSALQGLYTPHVLHSKKNRMHRRYISDLNSHILFKRFVRESSLRHPLPHALEDLGMGIGYYEAPNYRPKKYD
jgi:hypothetical protein